MGFLSTIDGFSHLNWTQNLGQCFTNYHGLSCLIGHPFSFNPFIYWLFWFAIIFIAMPLFLYYLTKNKLIIPGYFLFTGIPFIFDGIGFYSQFLLSFFLVYLILEKDFRKRLFISLLLITGSVFGLVVHSQQLELGLAAIFIEITLFVLYKFDFKKYFLFLFGFSPDFLRSVGYNKMVTGFNFIPTIIYYSYHLFVKSMFFVFSVPAFIHIIVKKDWRKLLWLGILFFSSVYMWFFQSFANDTVLRIFVLFGFVLLPSFLEWLVKQSKIFRFVFWLVGFLWFCFNLYNWWVFKNV